MVSGGSMEERGEKKEKDKERKEINQTKRSIIPKNCLDFLNNQRQGRSLVW